MTGGLEVKQHDGAERVALPVEQLQEMVGRLLPEWIEKLGLPHWNITVVYAECDSENWQAQCDRQPAYELACITLDPQHHYDEEDVQRSLIHELLHIKLWPLDLYRDVMTQHIKPDTAAARQEQALWTYCVEKGVKDLRRMVAALTGFY